MAINNNAAFSRVIDVYLFSELYKRGIIKSKSFNFSNSLKDVRSKVMFILKSLAINAVKQHELETIFTKTFFERGVLSLNYNMNRRTLQGNLGYYYTTNYLENVECQFATAGYYRLDFNLREIEYLFEINHTELLNTKEYLNDLINNILFVQSAICDVGLKLKEFSDMSHTDMCKLKNSRYLCNTLYGADRADVKNKIDQLWAIEEHRETIFETSLTLLEEDSYSWGPAIKSSVDSIYTEYVLGRTPNVTEAVADEVPEEEGRYIMVGGVRVPLND